jgi:Ran GTPase-activating protein (RanGAP) involved in mRNA processing and transport
VNALKGNRTLTKLNLSGNRLGAAFCKDLANAIPTMGALVTLIFGGDGYEKFDEDKADFVTITPDPAVLEVGMAEADFSNKNLGPGGAIITAAWISHKDNGALEKLVLSNNGILKAEAGEALGKMLRDNSVLKELELSNLGYYTGGPDGPDGPGFAKGIADGLSANGALVKLTMGNNSLQGAEAGKALGNAIAVNTVLKELDLSSPKNDHGYNNPCDAAFAKELAAGLGTNGALTSLNISSNRIGLLTPPDGWSNQYWDQSGKWRHTDGRQQEEPPAGSKPEGVIALADAIRNNGALAKLNIRNNYIPDDQQANLKDLCTSKRIALTL